MSENPKIFNSPEGILDIWSVNLDEPKSLDKSKKAEDDLKKSLPLVAPKKSEIGEKDNKPVSTPPFAPEKPAGVLPNKADDSNSLKSLEKQMRADENDITTQSHQTAELDNRSIRL